MSIQVFRRLSSFVSDAPVSCFTFSRPFSLFHFFPLFCSVSHFPSVFLGFAFPALFSQFHIFPRFLLCSKFSRSPSGLHFPRLEPAARFCTGHRLLLFSLLCCLRLFWLARLAKGFVLCEYFFWHSVPRTKSREE